MSKIPTREEAFDLLRKYNQTESLIKHALSVEGVMRYCARKRKADEEKWGIIGMIPDLDYEQFPDQHCIKTEAILKKNVWPEEHIRAVVSHGWGIGTDVEPQSEMGKGVEMLGVQVSDLIIDTISGMQDVAEQIVGF